LNVSISGDHCGCLPNGTADVLINGSPPPVCVEDGDSISVSISTTCTPYTSDGPHCDTGSPFMARALMKSTVYQTIKKKILSRIKVVRAGRSPNRKMY
jgi:hypothetical protein